MKIELAKTEVIHFIGIGGIGMSGLSLIMKGMGFNVQGSDISNNKNIDRLKKKKLKFQLGIRGKIYKKQLYWLFLQRLKKTTQSLLRPEEKIYLSIKEVKC